MCCSKDKKNGCGYILVDPVLKAGQYDEKVPLDCITCQTVLTKSLGPLPEWKARLQVPWLHLLLTKVWKHFQILTFVIYMVRSPLFWTLDSLESCYKYNICQFSRIAGFMTEFKLNCYHIHLGCQRMFVQPDSLYSSTRARCLKLQLFSCWSAQVEPCVQHQR